MHIRFQPDRPQKPLGDLFGIFFEDLNHAADGGLYGEMIRNRDFEFDPIDNPKYTALTGWRIVGQAQAEVRTETPAFPQNPHYVRVTASAGGGLANEGYDGVCVETGKQYRLRAWLRAEKPLSVTVRLADAAASFTLTEEWQCCEAELSPAQAARYGELSLTADAEGCFEAAYVSLFPADSWDGILRCDLAQALADMKPKFMRFPGGCLTHDGQLDRFARDGMYNWKNTIGPVENRPGKRNSWRYHQTLGLGFYEYFKFCEQIGAEPIPVVSGGCDPHHKRFATGEMLERFIQDAVDLIDFAKGGVDTEWGRVRAEMGHPVPFGLKYIGVGNEEVHQEFFDRLPLFVEAIRRKDPEVQVIGTAGPFCAGGEYERGWNSARECRVDYVDEHYYQTPEWLLANVHRYDGFDPNGPKVFLGEFACWGNKVENALAEAAYMTGLQNAPAVGLCCYAPLLCHVRHQNWGTNMIYYDGQRMCRTANYLVQKMFMEHQGEWGVALDVEGNEVLPAAEKVKAGALRILANDTRMQLTNVTLTTAEGTQTLPDAIVEGKEPLNLGATAGDFTLECTVRRLEGWKGMYIHFCRDEQDDGYQWCFGGWENQDTLIEKCIHGRSGCMTQTEFSVEDVPYILKLELSGDRIRTWINGEMMNDVVDSPLQLQPLYLAGSREGDTMILKAVNVLGEDCTAQLECPFGGKCQVEVLTGHPQAENTLDTPDVLATIRNEMDVPAGFSYTFPAHSVTVLRLSKA